MSESMITVPLEMLNGLYEATEELKYAIRCRLECLGVHVPPFDEALPPSLPMPQPANAPKPRRRRPPRTSGLYAVLHAAQQHGFTPPQAGHWLMLPPEFAAVLALEPKAIAQVVLEILQQTIGTVVYGQDGHSGRKEWATISYRHFARGGDSLGVAGGDRHQAGPRQRLYYASTSGGTTLRICHPLERDKLILWKIGEI